MHKIYSIHLWESIYIIIYFRDKKEQLPSIKKKDCEEVIKFIENM